MPGKPATRSGLKRIEVLEQELELASLCKGAAENVFTLDEA